MIAQGKFDTECFVSPSSLNDVCFVLYIGLHRDEYQKMARIINKVREGNKSISRKKKEKKIKTKLVCHYLVGE